MLDQPSLPPGVSLAKLGVIDSTNLEALRRARGGAHGPLWLWADSQSSGRGRQGREWVSEQGNLYTTLLLTNTTDPASASGLAFVAALALSDAVVTLAPGLQASLKWPNDVLVNGAKVAGILIETETSGQALAVAIGMGLNLAHAPRETRYPATSLSELGHIITPQQAFPTLAHAMAARLGEWDEGRGLTRQLAHWEARAYGLGHTLTLSVGTETLTGRFTGLAENGAMRLTLADGTTRILHAGEVRSTLQPTTGAAL
jgi:BirA family biotin operon repressor/biotin-[acetyl-CoA-carboxylase] ligase